MGRKLRSMFKPVTPRPGTGERPASPGIAPVVEPMRSVAEPSGTGGDAHRDAVAKLAYERWLETGEGEVENWVWAEAELKRRGM